MMNYPEGSLETILSDQLEQAQYLRNWARQAQAYIAQLTRELENTKMQNKDLQKTIQAKEIALRNIAIEVWGDTKKAERIMGSYFHDAIFEE